MSIITTPGALSSLAIALGLVLGLASWGVLASLFPASPRQTGQHQSEPQQRIAHALRDVSPAARQHLAQRVDDPLTVLGVVVSPSWQKLINRLNRILGGSESASRLVAQAGLSYDASDYRLRRVLWAMVGAVAALILVSVVSVARQQSVAIGLVAVVIAGATGAVAGAGLYDRQLRKITQARQQRLAEEFPSILELLALALSAGESLPGALNRIAQRGNGELAAEWARVMRRVELGEPLGLVLRQSAESVGVAEIQRLVEHLSTALERGAPLAEVVRSHSADSRNDQLRAIVDRAGKAEVWMLIPLVLLILPTTVIFAVWPSLQAIQGGL